MIQKLKPFINISLLFKILVAIVAAAIISFLKLDTIESFFFDQRLRLNSSIGLSNPVDPKSVLIVIDNATIEKYKGFPSFADHAVFLSKLRLGHPKFYVYDFRMKDNAWQNISGGEDQQKLFLHTAESLAHFYFITDDLEMKGEAGKLKLPAPLESLNLAPAPKTYDTVLFAKDGVSRRFFVSYQDNILLHPKIAGWYNKEITNANNIKSQFPVFDSMQGYVYYFKRGSYPTYKFEDVMEGRVPLEVLQDKIVIVGSATGQSSKEFVSTPLSSDVNDAMPSVEYHANVFQTLIQNKAPYRTPDWVTIIVTFLISFLTVYTVFKLRPSQGLIILFVTISSLAVLYILLFSIMNVWADFAHPLLTVFICYYFFIPYRLIKENRLSWEYYQRNKLLKQVEELKMNFISMMSHDLKTPIARIQGMTEVILGDSQPLSVTQQDAIDHIKNSSDDLLGYINSILQYGRIESQNLELNLVSKDVNKVLHEVIKKYEFFAKVKKIKVNVSLEPLFPIRIDSDLMGQIFSNLLENAIKYSPENSTISISSKEENNTVYIEFRDTGMGIPKEDLPNIFMKFFRSHNVKISNIKGSGLGLYLANYFTELHGGKITVTSEDQKGSTFTVELPIN